MPRDNLDKADADIILRSVDGREFRAHKTILSLASPVFQDTLSLPQPPYPEPASIPVVDLSETGEVLDVFLKCIYLGPKKRISELNLLEALVAAADKYEAKIVLDVVGQLLKDPSIVGRDPVRAYAITRSSPALVTLAENAANRMTLDAALDADKSTIARLGTANHHKLVTYLAHREKKARSVLKDYSSWPSSSGCGCESGWVGVRQEIGRAITDSFVWNPSLSTEAAVVLSQQLSRARACHWNKNCSFVSRGERYAKDAVSSLKNMSHKLWSALDCDQEGQME